MRIAIFPLLAAALHVTGAAQDDTLDVLVFTRTEEMRHDSIEAGARALEATARERGWRLTRTEDPETFSDDALAEVDVVVFLNTSGNVLDQLQEAAFERFIRSGKGFVGVHGAADTERGWPFFGRLVGAWIVSHPDLERATLVVEDSLHPSTAGLDRRWEWEDVYYNFHRNPRATANVVLSVDETTYDPGGSRMGDHPIAWYQSIDGGRAFYTGLGHTEEAYRSPLFLAHLEGAIFWAGGR